MVVRVVILFHALCCFWCLAWCLSADQTALQSLSVQLKGKDSSTWNTQDSDPCKWAGVKCDSGGTSVTQLSLQGFRLGGVIPSIVGDLQSLIILDLSNNMLGGPIPDSLSNCSNLTLLNLSSNILQGTIPPDLQKLQLLQILDLSGNNLAGPIPPELGGLLSLKKLFLASNHLTEQLPLNFGSLVAMEDLSVAQNSLMGSIPDISKLTNLRSFAAYQNKFSGMFPNVSTKSLVSVNLASNGFTGSIPLSLCASGQFEVLVLTNNNLTGSLPDDLGHCQSLTTLRVGWNLLGGAIPQVFGQLSSLTYFEAHENRLTGKIPVTLNGWKNLSLLNLAHNLLTGPIPSQISELLMVQELFLSDNNLTGEIPSGLSECEHLSVLDLSNNALSGPIPQDLCGKANITILRFKGNSFSGPIPFTIGNCLQLLELQLGDNKLSGSIPSTVGSLTNLQVSLNLSLNDISGVIPASIGKLSKLVSLDLSYNQLTGDIPPLNGMISLLDWNFSNNLLSGPVPQIGLPRNSSSSVYTNGFANNSGLCDGPLLPCDQLATANFKLHNSTAKIAGIVAACTIVVILVIAGITFRIIHTWHAPSAIEQTHPLTSANVFTSGLETAISFDSIKDATHRGANLICSNQWSSLYKAVMPSGLVLAAKKLHPREKGWIIHQRKITAELEKFSRFLHGNIMHLSGYLLENDLVIIVYDFVPSCSLAQRLHRKSEQVLSWLERFDIAIGAARGLAFLHHSQFPVTHMDVTSNNIFLGADLQVKVGDIEVGKLLDPSKNTGSISAVAGSLGYIAPEYAFTMRVTAESNVYSFGVILLELLTGRRPIDESFGDGMDVVRWVQGSSERGEMPEQILDARISTSSFASRQEMLSVLKIAMLCTSVSPLKRPRMKRILEMLVEAKLPAEAYSPKP